MLAKKCDIDASAASKRKESSLKLRVAALESALEEQEKTGEKLKEKLLHALMLNKNQRAKDERKGGGSAILDGRRKRLEQLNESLRQQLHVKERLMEELMLKHKESERMCAALYEQNSALKLKMKKFKALERDMAELEQEVFCYCRGHLHHGGLVDWLL